MTSGLKRALFFLLLAVFAIPSLSGCSKAPKKSVIFISVDTLRADALGTYGRKPSFTPGFDELASIGTVYENMVASSPWTLSSHASMLTGLYPYAHRAIQPDTPIKPSAFYLPEFLKAEGFATGGFVSHTYVNQKYGFNRGMDVFEHLEHQPANVILTHAGKWIKQQKHPFFCFIHLFDPHGPYNPPPSYIERFGIDCPVGVPSNANKQIKFAYTPGGLKCLKQLYAGEVAFTDQMILAFLKELNKNGYRENILVVLTSDHGEAFMEHGLLVHGNSLFQELLWVPLIMIGDGFESGKRVADRASHVDLVPTILSWLSLPKPEMTHGVDLQDALTLANRPASILSMAFLKTYGAMASYKDEYKYIDITKVQIGDKALLEKSLFNLEKDREEKHNLVGQGYDKIIKSFDHDFLQRPELTGRNTYAVRYQAGDTLGDVQMDINCEGEIAWCNVLDCSALHGALHPFCASKQNAFEERPNGCSIRFTKPTSPKVVALLPNTERQKCTATFKSDVDDGEKLVKSILLGDTENADSTSIAFPLGKAMPDSSPDDTITAGEMNLLTLTQTKQADQGEVELDEETKERLRSLGYIQ